MAIKNDQSGFSVVEALLILIVFGMLGFTGWFVYHSKQATDNTLKDTGKSSLPVVAKKTAASPSRAKKYLAIKEWGIKVDVSDQALANAVYVNTPTLSDGVEGLLLATKNTVSMDYTCGGQVGDGSEPITHTQTSDQDYLLRSKSSTSLTTDSNHPASDFVNIGNYYYIYAHNSGHGTVMSRIVI